MIYIKENTFFLTVNAKITLYPIVIYSTVCKLSLENQKAENNMLENTSDYRNSVV